jgi:hypothetical protein
MEVNDYPALFQESDSRAKKAQQNHFRFIRAKVALVIFVGLITAVVWDKESTFKITGGVLLTTFLVLSIVITAITLEKKFDEEWFGMRAIAESTKAETWNFVMKLKPYDDGSNDSDRYFLERLRELLRVKPNISSALRPHLNEGVQITSYMRRFRNETFEARKDNFIQNRIRDQKLWYSKKADWNNKLASIWQIITWALEILAVVFGIVTIFAPTGTISPPGIVLSASAGVLFWLNTKSYAEASKSYGLVAEDLAILEEEAKNILSEDKFSKVVSDVENAISLEHRVWLGRVI